MVEEIPTLFSLEQNISCVGGVERGVGKEIRPTEKEEVAHAN